MFKKGFRYQNSTSALCRHQSLKSKLLNWELQSEEGLSCPENPLGSCVQPQAEQAGPQQPAWPRGAALL